MAGGKGLALRRENLPFHLLRAVLGTIGILCNFYAVDHLVLSNASILNKMSPFFVLIFSYLFLKEKLTPFQISAFVVAFAGSLFVVKPTLSNLDLGPSLIGLCSGIAAGGAYTMVRILGLRGERSSVIVLFFSVFSCLSVVPWMIFHFQPMTWRQLLMLIGAGISATGDSLASLWPIPTLRPGRCPFMTTLRLSLPPGWGICSLPSCRTAGVSWAMC